MVKPQKPNPQKPQKPQNPQKPQSHAGKQNGKKKQKNSLHYFGIAPWSSKPMHQTPHPISPKQEEVDARISQWTCFSQKRHVRPICRRRSKRAFAKRWNSCSQASSTESKLLTCFPATNISRFVRTICHPATSKALFSSQRIACLVRLADNVNDVRHEL